MNIQLKQVEIVAALTGYLATQGINLFNKEVKIDFTAGRKAAGITADVTIEDFVVPALGTAEPVDPATVEVTPEPVVETTPIPETVSVEKTTSLFS